MDDTVYSVLKNMNLKNIELIALKDFEDPELLSIKNSRTSVEYCWTCTSSLPLYLLKKYPNLENIAYLDADLFFYNSLKPIYDEFGNNSVLIIRHNYSKEYVHLEKRSGIYNVEMLIFQNDANAINCLDWWRKKCLECCSERYKNGKFGDQLYLNDWPQRFKKVKVLQHKGGGVAPWNYKNYKITQKNNKVYVDNNPLIFYHFHQLFIFRPNLIKLVRGYSLSKNVKKLIYYPYLESLRLVMNKSKTFLPDSHIGFKKREIYKDIIRPTISKIIKK
ncbi:MAG: glycosyl transferase [Candidatus Nealsonbacteria bacterium CG08_land_8_20_14_0_20_36_22]|nr:MAG: glycosyl transferase [Candidatus Nealsonbacteria bacterium CG08_land_8_20_14_0_20_36_22]